MSASEFNFIDFSSLPGLSQGAAFTADCRMHDADLQSAEPSVLLRQNHHVIKASFTENLASTLCETLTVESYVRVRGIIIDKKRIALSQARPLAPSVSLSSLVVLSAAKPHIPYRSACLNISKEVEKSNGCDLSLRLDNRVLDLRSTSTGAIAKLLSAVHQLTTEHLAKGGYHWVSSPMLIDYALPGDNDYFEVNYMGAKKARLAQSSEIHLGMALSGDLERVYDIHNSFRREINISTRHLTEFVMIEAFLKVKNSWTELIDEAEALLLILIKSFQHEDRYHKLLRQTSEAHPNAVSFKLGLDEDGRIPRVTFRKAKYILSDVLGRLTDFSKAFSADEERLLGEYFATTPSHLGQTSDIFIITHFPRATRPFNFHPSDEDHEFCTNSFDVIIRGQECCTSTQFIHSYQDMRSAMLAREPPIDPDAPEWEHLTRAYEAAMPPWGGFGIGLNRFVQGFLGLDDIREAVVFPRDASRLRP